MQNTNRTGILGLILLGIMILSGVGSADITAVNLMIPANLTEHTTDSLTFIYNVTGNRTGVGNYTCSLWHDLSGTYVLNTTNTTDNNTAVYVALTGLSDGTYLWGVNCTDSWETVWGGNYTLYVSHAADLVGNVTTQAGTVISGATIQIVGAGSGTTDATGWYNITGQSPGNYTAYADATGYYRSIASIELTTGFTSQNFSLTAPSYTIGDVDDIFIDVLGTGAVEVKSEMPTLVDLALLWVILAMLVSIVALALGVFLVAPEQIKKRMGHKRT